MMYAGDNNEWMSGSQSGALMEQLAVTYFNIPSRNASSAPYYYHSITGPFLCPSEQPIAGVTEYRNSYIQTAGWTSAAGGMDKLIAKPGCSAQIEQKYHPARC